MRAVAVEQSGPSSQRLVCDSLALKAQLDFQQGVRIYTRSGLASFTDQRGFFEGYLYMRYQVKVEQSCVVEPFPRFCYSSSMNACLEEELGKLFFVQAYEEAERYFRLLQEEGMPHNL